jgi:hypothetical protein
VPSASLRSVRSLAVAAAIAIVLATLALGFTAAPPADAAQPAPGHTGLVPSTPRTNTPRISSGEIWDIEVVGQRVFIAGTFSSLQNTTGTTAVVNQRYLASYNYQTGLIDTSFRPTFGGGGVTAVEASPDGTKLFVAGSFNTVNGVTKRKIASINLTTGAPVAGFTANASAQATALAATNTTLYVGGNFKTVNGAARVGLAAVNGTTGAVVAGFVNDISGGIGVNGMLTVQQLKLTHDDSKLLVVHTGRKIANQDRYGVGLISTQTNQLLPWRTRLWDDNLQFVGGIQRIYAGDVAPNDQYFVVSSGSGGDRPPINDTAVAFPVAGNDNVQPLWVSRHFDSVYSVAITERAVYVGGHFGFQESPTAPDPWPGLDNVGYGTGQGLAGYGLGDAVVRRDHIGALNPADGKALEWNPGSNSFEGNKAMEATARGLFVGGDGMYQGGKNTGRVAFYDFNSNPAPSPIDTTIVNPIEGRVVASGVQFVIQGQATAGTSRVRRVQVEIQDRNTKQYLQDDMVSWGGSNNIYASLASTNAASTAWSLPVTVTGNRELQLMAKTFTTAGTSDATKAIKKIESFGVDDQTPTTSINGPSGSVLASTTFIATGTASDDKGVNALTYWFRDEANQYLQDDGSVSSNFNTFRGTPDVVGADDATHRGPNLHGDPRWPPHLQRHRQRHRRPGLRRDLAAQQHHQGAAGLRRHLGHRRDRRLVPRLPGRQHQQHQLQLGLPDPVRPHPGPVLVQRAGHRRDRPDDLVDQPGPPDHQRPGGRGRLPRRPAELHRHRRHHRGPAPGPGRHGHRRQGRPERPGLAGGPGHGPLRAAQRDHGGRLRDPERDPGLARRDQHDLDARGRPADQGRLRGDRVRDRHRRPAGHLDLGGHGQVPGLPR